MGGEGIPAAPRATGAGPAAPGSRVAGDVRHAAAATAPGGAI